MKSLLFSTLTAALSTLALSPQAGLTQELPTTLRQGMPYSQARQILMDAGWQAAYRSPMRQRFSPMDYLIDNLGYHEVVNCSGTGLGICWFEFTDAYGQILSVSTVRNHPSLGEPTVYGWQFDPSSLSASSSRSNSSCQHQLKPDTNVRTGPGTDSAIIATLRPPLNRDPVTVHSSRIGRDGRSWSWITFNLDGDDTPGWVRSDLIVCQ